MCSCQYDTYSHSLILPDLAMQTCMVYTILNSLGSVGNPLRKFYQFPIQMCPLRIGIIRHICFTLCILSLYVA